MKGTKPIVSKPALVNVINGQPATLNPVALAMKKAASSC